MTIKSDALDGKIIFVPLNGSPTQVTEIPDDMVPWYSGAVIILAGASDEEDTNLNIKREFGHQLAGDAVVVSQETWHSIKGET